VGRSWLDPVPIAIGDLDGSNPLLQSAFWARFKERFGWEPAAFKLPDEATLLALLRRLPGGFLICYVPHGPALTAEVPDVDRLAALARGIAGAYAARGAAAPDFVRFDLPFEGAAAEAATRRLPGSFVPAVADVQPPDTVIIDLTLPEEEILAGMKSKTRYNVRLSAKRGVEVVRAGAASIDEWYDMYRITAERDGIVIHSREYYASLFELSRDDPAVEIELLVASVDGLAVAGNIVVAAGGTGTYLFGASTNEHRNLMPTYGLQWEGMRLCKAWGCTRYDFGGIPPTDDPEHPMHGLYRMKTGFGGEIVHRPGAWDFPVHPLRYRIFRAAERAREYYYKRFRKRSR